MDNLEYIGAISGGVVAAYAFVLIGSRRSGIGTRRLGVTGGTVVTGMLLGLAFYQPTVNYMVFLLGGLVTGLVILLLNEMMGGRGSRSEWAYPLGVAVVTAALAIGVGISLVLKREVQMAGAILAGVFYGFIATLVPFGIGLHTRPSHSRGGRGTARTHEVTVEVRDETGEPISGTVPVELIHKDETTDSLDVVDGRATTTLRNGTWTAQARVDQTTKSGHASITRDGASLVIEFPGRTASIRAVNRETGAAVPDATVALRGAEKRWSGTTDQRGEWKVTVPRSVQDLTVEVDHERFTAVSEAVPTSGSMDRTVELAPSVGTLGVSVTLSGTGIAEIPVTATHSEIDVREQAKTGAEGRVTFSDLPIGEYAVEAALDDRPAVFSAERAWAHVREEQRRECDLTIDYDYTLAADHRQRIRTLRNRIEEIGRVRRRDSAIPEFYACVLESALDTAEAVPQNGRALLTASVDPDAAVGALLDAVEAAVETVDEVMTSKRNVDLFSACSDLPDASVAWAGEVSLARMADLARADIGQQRGEILEELETVDERISAAVSEIAEPSPAREMWEGVRTMVRDNTGASQLESAALILVAEALLDAVESLFDREPLRTRMERTVY